MAEEGTPAVAGFTLPGYVPAFTPHCRNRAIARAAIEAAARRACLRAQDVYAQRIPVFERGPHGAGLEGA